MVNLASQEVFHFRHLLMTRRWKSIQTEQFYDKQLQTIVSYNPYRCHIN